MRTATVHRVVKRTDESQVSRLGLVCRLGLGAIYRLSEPIAWDDRLSPTSFVFISTATILGAPETYAFPANERGQVLSWTELDGSQKGNASHAQVLSEMGYELVAAPDEKGGST